MRMIVYLKGSQGKDVLNIFIKGVVIDLRRMRSLYKRKFDIGPGLIPLREPSFHYFSPRIKKN